MRSGEQGSTFGQREIYHLRQEVWNVPTYNMIFGKVLGGIQEMVEINANAHGKLITYLEYFVFLLDKVGRSY